MIWVIVLVTAFGVGEAQAQTLRSDVDTTTVTVGDRITLTVAVEHASDSRVVWPDSLEVTPFDLIARRELPTATRDGGTVSTAEFVLSAFELGELELPSFEVAVVAADGSATALTTDRFGVEVLSVGADEGGDIREIRGPLGIPVSVVRMVLVGLLLLLVGAVLYALWQRFRRRDDAAAPRTVGPPPRAAHEIALEALAELESSPLLARGQVKDYHVRLSEILRSYVHHRFHVDAREMTTSETVAALRRVGVDGSFGVGLQRILDQCDLAKFAKVRPTDAASRGALAGGRELVTESAAPVAPVQPAEVTAADTPKGPHEPGGPDGATAVKPPTGPDAPTATDPAAARAGSTRPDGPTVPEGAA